MPPAAALSSHVWRSMSKWGAEELQILNIDNAIISANLLLDTDWRHYEDERLTRLLASIPCDVSSYQAMMDGSEYPDNIEDFEDNFNTKFGLFYEKMTEVVRTTKAKAEVESLLNISAQSLSSYIQEKGSSVPLSLNSNSSNSSAHSTQGLSGSPSQTRRIRFDTDSHDASRTREDRTSQTFDSITMPKSSWMKSIASNLSKEMGTDEPQTKQALYHLLYPILGKSKYLRVHSTHQRFELRVGWERGLVSINDGQVSLRTKLVNSNDIPLINIECKSRAGSSGKDILSKIYAQEFGECLAIVQKRAERGMFFSNRRPETHTVYSIGAHGRRAYLCRVDFGQDYLERLSSDDLEDIRVNVNRSDQMYRLDKKDELRKFVALIYRLSKQLEHEIAGGRRL